MEMNKYFFLEKDEEEEEKNQFDKNHPLYLLLAPAFSLHSI